MQGKLRTKSKVIYTIRPKSQVFRKRIKRERASTPQRWSRRIRSLPPIPINVIAAHRKKCKKNSNHKNDKGRSAKSEVRDVKRNLYRISNKKNHVFINKNLPSEKSDSVEVVRIVPVVVYVKKRRTNMRGVPEEIRVQINDHSTCDMIDQALNPQIRKRIKREPINLGRRFSRRIRMLPPNPSECILTARRKHPYRKKALLYG